jgi:hypothetical protein
MANEVLDTIKSMPGAEFLSDEDFKGMAAVLGENESAGDGDAAVGTAAENQNETNQAGEGEQQPQPLKIDGLTVYIDDKPVEDLRAVTLEDFLTKAQLGYKAMNAEQKKAFRDVVRVAQLGHLNQKQMEQLQQDVTTLNDAIQQQAVELNDYRSQSKVWDKALAKAATGDVSMLQQLVDRYQQNLASDDEEEAPNALPPAMQQNYLRMAGQQVFDQEIKPYLQNVAQQYGIGDVDALGNHVLAAIGRIPPALRSVERIQSYLLNDLIGEIESGVFGAEPEPMLPRNRVNGQFVSRDDDPIKKEIEALRELVGNMKEQLAGNKLNNAPPPSAPGGGDISELPEFMKSGDKEFDVNAGLAWLRAR